MMELLLKHLLTYYLRVNVSVLNADRAKKRVLIYPGMKIMVLQRLSLIY